MAGDANCTTGAHKPPVMWGGHVEQSAAEDTRRDDAIRPSGAWLQLQETGGNRFVSSARDLSFGRSFGGRLVAEAMLAASKTADPNYVPHSAVAQFLRAGDVREQTSYEVEILRDGRTRAGRLVRASQKGEPITVVVVSLSRDGPGPEHRIAMPDVPGPEALPDHKANLEALRQADPLLARLLWPRDHPVEFRPVDFPTAATNRPGRLSYWFRARPELTDSSDAAARAALIAYVSDRFVMTSTTMPHLSRLAGEEFVLASLDHAVWIHRDHTPGSWLFYRVESTAAAGSRAFVRGEVFSRDGLHIASVAQEGLLATRPRNQA
jgi:acyl-CoA thioesterase-2